MKKRESNIELLRIIMMLLIVAHHYVINSAVIGEITTPPYTWQNYFLFIFGMWGKIGINCFVLITGYFMCKQEISMRKFLKLFLEVCFYNIVIYLAFALAGYESLSIMGMVKAFSPIQSIELNFTSCFLIYYLLIPFLNVIVNNISKKQHTMLIGVCVLFFVLWDLLPGVEVRYNYVEWFCILHVIASYIRFYISEEKNSETKHVVLLILGGGMFAILSVVAQCYMIERGWHVGWQYKWVYDCNAIVGLISSIMIFVGFKNLHIGYHSWINGIAASTFAVFLIHSNSMTMAKWLWQDVCESAEWVHSPWMMLHAIGSVVGVFAACILIDKIRIYLIEIPVFKYIDKIMMKKGWR